MNYVETAALEALMDRDSETLDQLIAGMYPGERSALVDYCNKLAAIVYSKLDDPTVEQE